MKSSENSPRPHFLRLDGPKPKKQRNPIPKVSERRKREGREYTKLRKEYLSRFPYCQIWLAENKFDHTKQPFSLNDEDPCFFSLVLQQWVRPDDPPPRATEIHHGAKRGKNYLNTKTWWAASPRMHRKVEENKKWAREKGYMK